MGNQAKKLLNNKKLPKSLAVSSLILHRHLQVAQLAWASEPIEFGSAFVSIYGRASSCALFLTSRNQVNQNLEKWNRQVSGSTLFHLQVNLIHIITISRLREPIGYSESRNTKMEKKEKKIYQSPTMTVYEISRTQILAGSADGGTETLGEEEYTW